MPQFAAGAGLPSKPLPVPAAFLVASALQKLAGQWAVCSGDTVTNARTTDLPSLHLHRV